MCQDVKIWNAALWYLVLLVQSILEHYFSCVLPVWSILEHFMSCMLFAVCVQSPVYSRTFYVLFYKSFGVLVTHFSLPSTAFMQNYAHSVLEIV